MNQHQRNNPDDDDGDDDSDAPLPNDGETTIGGTTHFTSATATSRHSTQSHGSRDSHPSQCTLGNDTVFTQRTTATNGTMGTNGTMDTIGTIDRDDDDDDGDDGDDDCFEIEGGSGGNYFSYHPLLFGGAASQNLERMAIRAAGGILTGTASGARGQIVANANGSVVGTDGAGTATGHGSMHDLNLNSNFNLNSQSKIDSNFNLNSNLDSKLNSNLNIHSNFKTDSNDSHQYAGSRHLDGTNTDGTGGTAGTEQTSATVQTSNTHRNGAGRTDGADNDNDGDGDANNVNLGAVAIGPGFREACAANGTRDYVGNGSAATEESRDRFEDDADDADEDGGDDGRTSLLGGATRASAATATATTTTTCDTGARRRRRRPSDHSRDVADHAGDDGEGDDADDANDNARNSDLSLEWIQHYIELQQHHSLHGTCLVSSKGPYKNKPLAKWVKKQKKEYRRWMMQRQRRQQHQQKHNPENDDAEGNEEDRTMEMTEERIRLLENVGMEWDYSDRSGSGGHRSQGHRVLRGHFVNADGASGEVDRAIEDGGMIGNRSGSRNRRKSGGPRHNHGHLNDDNATDIDAGNASNLAGGNPAMNAAASVAEAEWKNRYDELVQFKNQFGHTNVPEPYQPNLALGVWVKEQRQQYKWLLRGKPSRMTNARVQLLEAIQFEWQMAEMFEWKRRYRELQLFKSRFGHANVPVDYCGGGQHDLETKGSPTSTQNTHSSSTSSNSAGSLGRWVREQRAQKRLWDLGRASTMTMERASMLEGVGFCWDSDEEVLNRQQLRQVLRHQPPGQIAVSGRENVYATVEEVDTTKTAGVGSASVSSNPIKREFLSSRDPVPSQSESSSSSGGSRPRHHSQKVTPPVATTQQESSNKTNIKLEDGKPYHVDRNEVKGTQSAKQKKNTTSKKKRKRQETVTDPHPKSAQKVAHSTGSPGTTAQGSQSRQSNVALGIIRKSPASNINASSMPQLQPVVEQRTSVNLTGSNSNNSVEMNKGTQSMMEFGNTNSGMHQVQANSITQQHHVPSIPPLNDMFKQSLHQLVQQQQQQQLQLQQPQMFNIQQAMQPIIQPLPANQHDGSEAKTTFPQPQRSDSGANANQNLANTLQFIIASTQQPQQQSQVNPVQIQFHANQIYQHMGILNNFAGPSTDNIQSNMQISSSPSCHGASPLTSALVVPNQGGSSQKVPRGKVDSTTDIKARARSSTGKGEQWVRRYHELKAYKGEQR
ncbi:hypothetical protein ACHAXS_005092 [Conticribra weissflogii]